MDEGHHREVETGLVVLRWESHDRHPRVTWLALVGVPLLVMLALWGLPPVDLHGPLHYLGVMGPTCGLTRGVMLVARGDLGRAWAFNPASLLVIPAMVAVLGRAVYGRVSGRLPILVVRWRPWLWLVPAALVLALSVRQQLNVDFLLANLDG